MHKLDLKRGKYPIIIKPNLGQPILINLRDFKFDKSPFIKKITFTCLIIAIPDQSIQEISRYFHLNTYIQPILKDEGDFKERRGKKYPLRVLEIKKIHKLDFREQGILEEENCIQWDIFNTMLKIDNIFGERKELYEITFQIKRIYSIIRLLKETGRFFLLFDIVQDLLVRIRGKVNYHSLALFDKDWTNFKFIHATDLHIAQRNDSILKFLKDKVRESIKDYEKKEKKDFRIDKFVLTRDFEFKEDIQENRLNDLRYAKYNFNYNLRKLIDFVNERVMQNELDFVLMTGDLVDYVNNDRENNYYKNNFQVLIDILLGLNRRLDKNLFPIDDEYLNKKEILCPIFTIVGNHDYRKGAYDIQFGNLHELFGMTEVEIKGYQDIKFINIVEGLRSKDKYLKDYFRYVNPNLNFKIKIGNLYNFIFLDTGEDSIADIHDLLQGNPSTKGIKHYQIDLLRAYIQLCHDEKIIVVMHAPPINPDLGITKLRKFEKKFKLKREVQWSDFYEDNLKNYLGISRLEKILNLKYQTIMYNWATLLKIFVGSDKKVHRKVDFVLCGHVHTEREFRLKEMKRGELNIIGMGLFYAKIPIIVPCEIYTNKYRDIFQTFKNPIDLKSWFDVYKPFIFQTQATGPISLTYKFKPPGFRYFAIKENQLKKIKIYSLHLKESVIETDK